MTDSTTDTFFSSHPRLWNDFHYVYPVISRRSRGLSVGINLNIDKVCNFSCVYCCVDHSTPPPRTDIDLAQLRNELAWMLDWAQSGRIWEDEYFSRTPIEMQRINDIAFSGDGEPTAFSGFADACRIAVEERSARNLLDVKIAVLTNATLLHKTQVQKGMTLLDQNNGEYWVKLDAGTAAYYAQIDRSKIPFDKILGNIALAGQTRPIILQSLFSELDGAPLPDTEFDAWCDRVDELLSAGCQIKDVQIHTVARRTLVKSTRALPNSHLDRLKTVFTQRFPTLPCDVYYGVSQS